MQYLSPEGTPQQASVQYIQLLRPVMMVPASPYMPAKPNPNPNFELNPSFEPIQTPLPISSTPKPSASLHNFFGSYSRHAHVGAYSSPHTSYFQTNPRLFENSQKPVQPEIKLNMNEYMPSASSQHFSAVLAPRSSMISSLSPYAYNPTKFQTRAQRA